MKPKTLPKSRFSGLCWALWVYLWWFSATYGVTLRCDCQLPAKICQHSPNLVPTSPNLAQLGSNLAQLGPNLAPTWSQHGPNLAPNWTQDNPTWPNLAPTFPNLVPTWSQQGPTWPNRAQLGSKLVPKLINLAPTWLNLVPSWLSQFRSTWRQLASQFVTNWYQFAYSCAPTWPILLPNWSILYTSTCTFVYTAMWICGHIDTCIDSTLVPKLNNLGAIWLDLVPS